MQLNKVFALLLLLSVACGSFAQNKYQWKQASAGGYTYKYVTNDPIQTRFYTLKNGLSVMLTVNHKEPRIVYRMAVRTGSNNDPKDHTGLAHYLEENGLPLVRNVQAGHTGETIYCLVGPGG